MHDECRPTYNDTKEGSRLLDTAPFTTATLVYRCTATEAAGVAMQRRR